MWFLISRLYLRKSLPLLLRVMLNVPNLVVRRMVDLSLITLYIFHVITRFGMTVLNWVIIIQNS
jgi:hypothetical protein